MTVVMQMSEYEELIHKHMMAIDQIDGQLNAKCTQVLVADGKIEDLQARIKIQAENITKGAQEAAAKFHRMQEDFEALKKLYDHLVIQFDRKCEHLVGLNKENEDLKHINSCLNTDNSAVRAANLECTKKLEVKTTENAENLARLRRTEIAWEADKAQIRVENSVKVKAINEFIAQYGSEKFKKLYDKKGFWVYVR